MREGLPADARSPSRRHTDALGARPRHGTAETSVQPASQPSASAPRSECRLNGIRAQSKTETNAVETENERSHSQERLRSFFCLIPTRKAGGGAGRAATEGAGRREGPRAAATTHWRLPGCGGENEAGMGAASDAGPEARLPELQAARAGRLGRPAGARLRPVAEER